VTSLDEAHLVAWSGPGRAFGRERAIATHATHGNGTTRPCVAVVAGGNPLVPLLAERMRRAPPPLRSWTLG
jgi:hypothetical protein